MSRSWCVSSEIRNHLVTERTFCTERVFVELFKLIGILVKCSSGVANDRPWMERIWSVIGSKCMENIFFQPQKYYATARNFDKTHCYDIGLFWAFIFSIRNGPLFLFQDERDLQNKGDVIFGHFIHIFYILAR